MTWDDELEALAWKVYEALGDGALGKAYLRALPSAAVDQIPETLIGSIRCSGAGGDSAHELGQRRAVSVTALKAELRRFLRPD